MSRHATSLQGTNVGKTTIYSDGACSGNPGPGGWAARILYADGTVREIGGFSEETTNNRMELQAVIEGLKKLTRRSRVEVITDSTYVAQGCQSWMKGWK
ncbi:MAG: ribonuclease H family protein, partial [Candidatus Latescibacterota bacterium]